MQNTAVGELTINADVTFNQRSSIYNIPALSTLSVTMNVRATLDGIKRFLEFVVTSNHGLQIFAVPISRGDLMSNKDVLQFIPRGWTDDERHIEDYKPWLRVTRTIKLNNF